MTTYAINGFGRIGKLALRVLIVRGIKISWINDITGDSEIHAHLLEFDSVHGRWKANINVNKNSIIVDGHEIIVHQEEKIVDLPFKGIDVVIDCTGAFKTSEKLGPYFEKGVKKVVVSAPVKDPAAINIVYGINHDLYGAKEYDIVTAASCTTNCIAPVVKVLHENLRIKHGSITTIHDVTNTQTIVDRPAKDLRRARSALNSLIPTSTGSATAITLIYPELKGKLNGHAVRVPLLNASLTDCVFELEQATDVEVVNSLFKTAAEGNLKNILGYETKPLVSTDYVNDPRSCIIDAQSTMVINDTQVKIYAWYDNEVGYTHRLVDIVEMVGNKI